MTRGLKPSQIVPASSAIMSVSKPPVSLSPAAKREWKHYAPILVAERNVLTAADLGCLRLFCIHLALADQAQFETNRDGTTINGKRHPAYGILKESTQLALRAAGELGLTPYSRSRAAIVGDREDELSPLDL